MTPTLPPPESPPPAHRRPAWPAIRDTVAFGLGSFILLWQTVAEETAQVELVVVGFACLGITGSGVAQRWLEQRFPVRE